MNETHKTWQGWEPLRAPRSGGRPAPAGTGRVPHSSGASPPVPSRSRPRLAAVIAAAVLAGGASGAGVVVALDRGAPTAGPTIVQERAPANGSARPAPPKPRPARSCPASYRSGRAVVAARGSSWTGRVTCSPTTM